jgi:hypothetical protein
MSAIGPQESMLALGWFFPGSDLPIRELSAKTFIYQIFLPPVTKSPSKDGLGQNSLAAGLVFGVWLCRPGDSRNWTVKVIAKPVGMVYHF